MTRPGRLPRAAAQALVRGYQLTVSAVLGRQCRHIPSCSDYAIDALGRHGAWAGSWMATARICRCGPLGTAGLDFVCEEVPGRARWYLPWRYARWRGTNEVPASRPLPATVRALPEPRCRDRARSRP